jgi:DUF2075 family protein
MRIITLLDRGVKGVDVYVDDLLQAVSPRF